MKTYIQLYKQYTHIIVTSAIIILYRYSVVMNVHVNYVVSILNEQVLKCNISDWCVCVCVCVCVCEL